MTRYCPDCPPWVKSPLPPAGRERCNVCRDARIRKYHKDRVANMTSEQRAERRAQNLAFYYRNRARINAAKRDAREQETQ